MSIKWSKKDVIAAFEAAMSGQTTDQGKSALPNLAEKIKELLTRNKGVKS